MVAQIECYLMCKYNKGNRCTNRSPQITIQLGSESNLSMCNSWEHIDVQQREKEIDEWLKKETPKKWQFWKKEGEKV
jgi:hypothetical protein